MLLPFFPLKTVFFPGETVPLHIFEERYKQLINDCRTEAATFGIPVYINETIAYGTEVQLVEVVTTYENGEMDVRCVARQVFRIKTFRPQLDGKLYAGGEVEFLDTVNDGTDALKAEVLDDIKELYECMDVTYSPIPLNQFNSYVLAHKMGFSFAQEYQLLQLARESDRLLFIQNHLRTVIGVLQEVDKTKKTIALNGHFKNFDPLDFDGLKT
ncbi:MAG: LON peptidase substrate-binding domain-containing protein [Flavobacteriaceae bacterium]